jgi:hypothetical protein
MSRASASAGGDGMRKAGAAARGSAGLVRRAGAGAHWRCWRKHGSWSGWPRVRGGVSRREARGTGARVGVKLRLWHTGGVSKT